MKTKNEKNINTKVPTSTWEWMKSLGSAGGTLKEILFEAERASKAGIQLQNISEDLLTLQMIRRKSLYEIRGIFSPDEWSLMADSLNGSIVTHEFRCLPSSLIASIEDSEFYDGLGEKWNVDTGNLCNKIKELTSAQVESIFTRVEEFWNDENRDWDKWSEW